MLKGFINVAKQIPLQLGGGETNLFPQVHIFDESKVEISGSPFDMIHKSVGLYFFAFTRTAPALFTLQFKIYTDSGHTTLTTLYGLFTDDLEIVSKIDELFRQWSYNLDNTTKEVLFKFPNEVSPTETVKASFTYDGNQKVDIVKMERQ